jgi:ornithine cyclodeaminase/alanine dehydrogenase-like protein (mu-crystallin family)
MPAPGGGFHVKAAFLSLQRSYFAAKVNGNFSGNVGMPAIQGVVYLADGSNGEPLAVMDSIEITILRTGAATAVAARHLARVDARVATVCGCGHQGFVQVRALARVLPLERIFAWDIDPARARRFAADVSAGLGIAVEAVGDPRAAVSHSDACVTCTPSREPFLRAGDLRPGTFVAAVGADSPDKQELEPAILASAKVVVDVLDQCAAIGELHHALEAGLMTRGQVHAELGEVVAGRKPGRTSAEEIIVFDSTGTALQDAAAAAVVYEKAIGP